MDFLSFYPAWLLEHGPAFLIALPLLAAAICAILPRRGMAWWMTLVVCLLCTVTAFGLFVQERALGLQIYPMGGWDPPHGISLAVDALNSPILLLIAFMGLITTIYALPAATAEISPKKHAPFYAVFMLCLAGLMGMVVTGDAFNVFVFLEVSSISTYALVAMGASRDRRALAASYNYLLLGSIGASFFVIGLGFLYMETGTLNMADIAAHLAEGNGGSRVAMIAFAFIVVGLGLKLAMFPLHMWLPGAYAYAPTLITIFLASTATKAALYLLLRFIFSVFDPAYDYVGIILNYLLVGVGATGMLFASLQAIFQTDARRTFAYSSVAQVGYMLLGIGIASAAGIAAGYLHLLNHAIIKGGLFIALGAFWYRFGITRIEDFKGLGQTMPWTMGAFTLAGLSLIGVPFTAGFVSKVKLVSALADQGWWWGVVVIALTSVLALIYVGRMLLIAYFQPPPIVNGETVARHEAPLIMRVPLWVLVMMSIAIGINAELFVVTAERAASLLLGWGG